MRHIPIHASVILADPIFKGLAIALMAGEIASLLISRMAVPVLYFMANRTRATRTPKPGTLPLDPERRSPLESAPHD